MQNNGNPTSLRLKTGLAEMLKGGVIMDVTNAEQALIAEKSGAVSVMALERVLAQKNPRNHGCRLHPCNGQVPHRPLRRGPNPPGTRRRLHRRIRSPHPRR